MKSWDRAANNNQKELSGDPNKNIICGPCLVGSVRKLCEILCLDAGADRSENVESKDYSKLHLLRRRIIELPDDCRRNDGEARVRKCIES